MARMVESEREVLRARHRVRPLEDAEEGYGIQRLPDGVYGFTYSPGPREFPLFKTGRPHTFEVHKLATGAVVLIGFASEDAASLVESGKAPACIRLFPAPHPGASTLVSVPLGPMVRFNEHSSREDSGLELQLQGAR